MNDDLKQAPSIPSSENSAAKVIRRVSNVAFWLFAVAAVTLAAVAMWKISTLYSSLNTARVELSTAVAERYAAQNEMKQFRDRLASAEGEVSQLCNQAKSLGETIAAPQNKQAREELGVGLLNRAHLIESIACKLDNGPKSSNELKSAK